MTITIGIAGITGKFARVLTSSLLKYPDIKVRGYCRDPSKAPKSFSTNPSVALVKGDGFDSHAIKYFVTGCDVVVCCYLGDDKIMTDGQKLLIDICEEQGVARYVASDWALDYTKLELGQLFPKDPQIKVKTYLDTKSTIKGVHILVGEFMNPFFSPPFGIWDPSNTTLKYWGSGNEMWEGTTYENAAEFTAAVCLDNAAIGIQKLVGGRSTFREIVASFEKVYDVRPTLECLGTLDDLYKRMHHLRNTEPQNFLSYLFLYFQYYVLNGQTLIGPDLDNDKYPQVTAIDWEHFMSATPLKQLAGTYFAVGLNV